MSATAAGESRTGASTFNDQLSRSSRGSSETTCESVVPATNALSCGNQAETNYGLLGGVNGDFPITKRTGFIAEVTYHWINYNFKVRYLTLSGGLRFSF